MSVKLKAGVSMTGAGVSMAASKTLEVSQALPISVSAAAGKAGTLTTRTDNVTGTLTMSNGHGITTGQTIFIMWTDGNGFLQFQRAVVGTVATNSVPFATGVGTNLPVATTAIVACVPTVVTQAFDSADMQALGVSASKKGVVQFRDGSTVRRSEVIRNAADVYLWSIDSGLADPLGGTVATIEFANADTASANAMSVLAGLST